MEIRVTFEQWWESLPGVSTDAERALAQAAWDASESARPEGGAIEEATAILKALSREYNKDELCDYKKINGLIERGEVFLSDGPVTSKAYWACWGGEGKPTPEDQAEYRRYCERAAKRMDDESTPQNERKT